MVKKTVVTMAGLMLATQAMGAIAPTATLSLRYAGSTMANLTGAQVRDGDGLSPNAYLTQVDLGQPAYETTSYKHYFDLGITFNAISYGANGYANEALRGLQANVTNSSALRPVTASGSSDPSATKYYPFTQYNLNGELLFNINGDAGPSFGDLQQIVWIQTSAATASLSQVGVGDTGGLGYATLNGQPTPTPTYIARIAMQFVAPLHPGETASVTWAEDYGQAFSYFLNANPENFANATYVTPPGGVSSAYYLIVATPEPTTTVLLGMGSILLVKGRRRRS